MSKEDDEGAEESEDERGVLLPVEEFADVCWRGEDVELMLAGRSTVGRLRVENDGSVRRGVLRWSNAGAIGLFC